MTTASSEAARTLGFSLPPRVASKVVVLALGSSLSGFLVFSYLLCVVGYLLIPGLPISHTSLAIFLPGFELLSWQSFFLGLVESFAWGWYVALILGPLYNFFVARLR